MTSIAIGWRPPTCSHGKHRRANWHTIRYVGEDLHGSLCIQTWRPELMERLRKKRAVIRSTVTRKIHEIEALLNASPAEPGELEERSSHNSYRWSGCLPMTGVKGGSATRPNGEAAIALRSRRAIYISPAEWRKMRRNMMGLPFAECFREPYIFAYTDSAKYAPGWYVVNVCHVGRRPTPRVKHT